MKKHQRGYSLLEVIIAFALLALALTLLQGSLSGAARQVGQAEVRSRATLYAQSLLASTGVEAPLQEGSTQGEWEQGKYRWRLQVEPYAEPRTTTAPVTTDVGGPTLAQITLQVRWGEGNGEQLQWRSLRLLSPVPGTPR